MDFDIPADIRSYLAELDAFIEREIKPLERENDNIRFFDHRREWARTDFERGGLPRKEWEELLARDAPARRPRGPLPLRAPRGIWRQGRRRNLAMAIIREHLAAKGLGLHNDLQNESSIVANLPIVLMLRDFGTTEQKERFIPGHPRRLDAHRLRSDRARAWLGRDVDGDSRRAPRRRMADQRRQDVEHRPAHGHARSGVRAHGGQAGRRRAASPASSSRPTAPASRSRNTSGRSTCRPITPRVSLTDVTVPADAILGDPDRRAGGGATLRAREPHSPSRLLARRGAVLHQRGGRLRQAAQAFGRPLAANQAIQWPLIELHTEAAMLRTLIHKTAWEMDRMSKPDIARKLSDRVAMCNYRGNRLVCDAADRAMQVHGGDRLFAPQAVRAHLSPPPALPHHGGLGGDPDAPRRSVSVRLLPRSQGGCRVAERGSTARHAPDGVAPGDVRRQDRRMRQDEPRATFTVMERSTAEDWATIASSFVPFAKQAARPRSSRICACSTATTAASPSTA